MTDNQQIFCHSRKCEAQNGTSPWSKKKININANGGKLNHKKIPPISSTNCEFIWSWNLSGNLKNEWCNVCVIVVCGVCGVSCNCRKPIAAYRCLSFSYHARKYYILHFKAFIVLIYYYAYNKTVCHLFLKLNVYLEVFVINIKTKCKKTRFWKTFLSNTT